MDTNLPKGWIETNLDELQTNLIGGDWGIAEEEQKENYVLCKVIRGTDFRYWDDERTKRAAIRKVKRSSLEKRQLILGDIVIEVSGGGPDQPVGRTIIIDKRTLDNEKLPLTCSNFFRKVSLSKHVNPFYINYHIKYAYSQGAFNDIQTHTTNLRNLRVGEYVKSPIPLPPLPEQQRIVEKLDTLMARISNSKTRLEKIPTLLKNFRQSVLAAAVSGELTKEWRKESSTFIDDVFDLELPTSWKVIPFEKLIIDGPQNGMYKPQSAYGSGTMILRIDNFYDGEVNPWNTLKRLQITKEDLETYSLDNGDIVVNRVNSMPYLGKSALIKDLQEDCVFESNMMRIKVDSTLISPEFTIRYLNSSYGITELRKNAKHAVNQASINQQDVKAVNFILPPLEEQKEIVRKVEELFHFADSIETRYQKAKAWFDKLPQSILAKAFRGELVPQNEKDEPASVILERIKNEKLKINNSKAPKSKAKQRKMYEDNDKLSLVAED